jgi:hypothetical protein
VPSISGGRLGDVRAVLYRDLHRAPVGLRVAPPVR